jgi:hypothetical protein
MMNGSYNYSSAWHAVSSIVRQRGLRGMLKGYWAGNSVRLTSRTTICMRSIDIFRKWYADVGCVRVAHPTSLLQVWFPWNAVYIASYEHAKKLAECTLHTHELPAWALMSCSASSATLACTLTHPVDVCKTQLQVSVATYLRSHCLCFTTHSRCCRCQHVIRSPAQNAHQPASDICTNRMLMVQVLSASEQGGSLTAMKVFRNVLQQQGAFRATLQRCILCCKGKGASGLASHGKSVSALQVHVALPQAWRHGCSPLCPATCSRGWYMRRSSKCGSSECGQQRCDMKYRSLFVPASGAASCSTATTILIAPARSSHYGPIRSGRNCL